MTRRKLKPFVLPTLYSLAVVIFILCMFLVQSILNNSLLEANELKDDIEYVDGDITDDIDKDIPVVATKIIINTTNFTFFICFPPFLFSICRIIS